MSSLPFLAWRNPGRRASLLSALLVLCFAVLLAGAPKASAHDQLVSSTPSDGKRLSAPPTQVSVTFSAALMDLGYEIRVVDAASKNWAQGKPVLARETLAQPLAPALPEGEYQVRWRVVSSDGHPISGSYSFLVGANAKAGTIPAPGLAPGTEPAPGAATPSAEAGATSESGQAAGVPGWLIAGGIGAAVGLGLFLAVRALQRLRRDDAA